MFGRFLSIYVLIFGFVLAFLWPFRLRVGPLGPTIIQPPGKNGVRQGAQGQHAVRRLEWLHHRPWVRNGKPVPTYRIFGLVSRGRVARFTSGVPPQGVDDQGTTPSTLGTTPSTLVVVPRVWTPPVLRRWTSTPPQASCMAQLALRYHPPGGSAGCRLLAKPPTAAAPKLLVLQANGAALDLTDPASVAAASAGKGGSAGGVYTPPGDRAAFYAQVAESEGGPEDPSLQFNASDPAPSPLPEEYALMACGIAVLKVWAARMPSPPRYLTPGYLTP